MGSRHPPLAATGSAFIPSISVDQTSPSATGTAAQNPAHFRQHHPPLLPSHSIQQVPPLPLASATPTPAATATNTPLNDVTRSPGRMQSGASSRAENLQVSGTPQRKMSYGVGKSNSMRVPRITERRHTLPPRQESIDAVSSAGSNNSNLTRSIKVVCVTAGAKDDLAVKLLRDACEKKKVQFQIIAYNEIAFDEVKATEQFLFADIAFVHLVSKEEESKLFLKIGHRRNYGKNVNVVLYQIPPANVSEEEQNALSYLKELCVEADTGLLPYYSLPGTSNSSNDMSLDLGHLVLLPALRTSTGEVESPEWTSLAHELRRVLNSFKQVANKDEALPIVTEMRDLMKTHKGVSLQVELARVYSEKLKQNRSQLTFETVHLFMMALRECQDYASMIDVFRYVRERNYELSQKEGLIYLYAFALNRRQDAGDREEALSIIETVTEPSADMLCLCGRIYKDLYIESSYQNERCLENAIQWYKKGAQLEPSDYAMINLATLLVASGKTFESDKDLKRLNNKLSYSIGSQGRLDQIQNYWVVATYFELCVLLDDKQQAVDAARRMFHLNAPAWYIKSTLHNLKLILSKRQELAKGAVSPYSNSSESSFSSRHQHKQQQLLTLPGHSFEDSVKLFDFWMQFFLFVGEDSSKAFCEYPVLVIEQVIRAQGNSPTPQRSYEFVPANLIIHRGPCDTTGENVQGPIESFDLLLIDSKSTNWQFPASDLAAVNTYMNDGRCLLMYVNRLDDFQVYFPSEAHRDRLYETLKSELFPDKNPIAPSNRQHQITNFTILKRPNGERAFLGSGAFGKVFKAMDTDTGTVFALKEIEMGFKASGIGGGGMHDGSGSGSMQLLRDEIQLHMRLKHQNIVKFLGHSIDSVEGKFCIFMEFVNGGSLSNFIQAHYRTGLPDSTAARFTNQILDGLIYLHEHEVIHRDIKGANVLVDLNNKDLPILKIADFGTSKQLSKINNLFNTNMKGTPNFLAPEVIACPRGYTYTADVWSLGCTVIEMISGKIPFHGMDAIFIIFQIGRGTATPSVPENSSKHAADFIEKCCKANPSERMSPKDLKVHPWIVTNRDPDSSGCGSSSNVSRATGSGDVGGATLPKSSSRALMLQKEYDRSISVPNPDEAKVTVEDELKDLDAARASAKFQSDPAVENQPKSTNSPERKLALRGRSSMPQGVLQGELRGAVAQQQQRHRHKSGESQATEVTTPTKSAKRASTVHDGVRHALTYYIDKHQDKILDLWMRDTQRLHFQNKLNIDTDLLRLLLSAFNDYLKSQDGNENLLNGGIDQVLDWIGEYDDSPVQVCEVFNSLKCFVETVTKLLKEGGDRADQVLQASFMLEPVVELAYYILSCRRPEALAMMDSTMVYDSGDEEEENNANTRESLDHIPETPSMPTFNDPTDLGPRSLNAREQQPLSFDHFQTQQQPRNLQGLNRQPRVNDSFNAGAPRSFYFPPSFNPLDPRNVSSEPNSMASSGITGSLSGFSNYFQHMAQETGRLERQLAETQLTLNNLLSVQLTLNQARIADIVRNINTFSSSTNNANNAQRNPPQQQSVPPNANRPAGVNNFPPHPAQMTSRGDTHPNTNSLFSQYNINNMINNAIVNNCAPMYGFRPVYFPSQGFNRAPTRPPPPMGYNDPNGGISTEESYEGTDGVDGEGNYVLVSELEPPYGNRAERSQGPETNPPTVTSIQSAETGFSSDKASTFN